MGTAERVRKLVEKHGPLAVPEIARRLGKDRRDLYGPLHALRRKRHIHVARHGRHLVASTGPIPPTAAARATLPPDLARLHAWLQKNPGHIQATIARYWADHGWKRSTTQYRLARLRAGGLATTRGQGRGATWHPA